MSWLFPKIKNTSLSQKEITDYMQPVQDVIGQMQGGYQQSSQYANQMMDPRSAMNRNRQDMYEDQGYSQMALQNLLNNRQSAALGQDSGITQSQTRQNQGQTGRNMSQLFQQNMMQQQQAGLGQFNQSQGMLGGIMQGQMGVTENITQAEIARRKAQMDIQMGEASNRQQFVGGLLGGVANIASGGLAGGYFGGEQ